MKTRALRESQLLAVREVLHARRVDHFISSYSKLIRIIAQFVVFSDSNFNLDKQFRSNIFLTGWKSCLRKYHRAEAMMGKQN